MVDSVEAVEKRRKAGIIVVLYHGVNRVARGFAGRLNLAGPALTSHHLVQVTRNGDSSS